MKKFALSALVIGWLLTPVLAALPVRAQAQAILFLSPASGTHEVGKTFTVRVMVNSGGGSGVNAADGVINFDRSRLSVAGIANTGSIFNLWTTEPTFSNSAGTISFGGGSPSAYRGDAGNIFTVTFRSLTAGEAEIKWQSGIVLAADGRGTNVFGGFGHAKFNITEATPATPAPTTPRDTQVEPTPQGIRPPTPEISSDSHSRSDVWYSENRPEFRWRVLADLTGISYAISNKAVDDPGDHADSIVEQVTMDRIGDGEWYFHLKFRNRAGWGQTAHYKFLVDATPPEAFGVAVDNESDATNPRPKLLFKAEDKTSGIKNYELTLGGNKTIIAPAEVERGYYRTGLLAPGDYEALVIAVDLADNRASSTAYFVVDPLRAPIITDAPGIINQKEQLIVQGTSFYPRVDIKVYVACNNQEPVETTVQTDDQNNWSYFHVGELERGRCEVWAKVVDSRGAQSLNSSKHLVTVISPSIVESYGLLIIVLLLIIIALLVGFILFQHHQFIVEKTRIYNETKEVKAKLSKIFAALREEVDELIELADKRPGLSESERRVKEKLQESLDISEEFIAKEVDDVEKEIKLKKSNI